MWWVITLLAGCPGGDPEDEIDLDQDGVPAGEDCDDTDPDEHPGVTWFTDADLDGYGAGAGQDCERAAATDVLDGTDCDDNDEGQNPSVTWYADADLDGYGDPDSASTCSRAASTDVANALDCDDTNPEAHPGATWFPDVDLDGFGDGSAPPSECGPATTTDAPNGDDCNDLDEDEHPGAYFWPDVDGDGYGDGNQVIACGRLHPSDVANASDCNDNDASEKPGVTWYLDIDQDGFGQSTNTSECLRQFSTDASQGGDCDDNDEDEHPGVFWYTDADRDGWGDEGQFSECLRNQSSDVTAAGDCDDGNSRQNPGLAEIAGDGLDNDCDGLMTGMLYVLVTPDGTTGANQVVAYEVDGQSGSPSLVTASPIAVGGNGNQANNRPRMVTNPARNRLYVINTSSNTLSVLSIDAESRLPSPSPGSPFALGGSPRDVIVHPDGRRVFVVTEPATSGAQLLGATLTAGVPSTFSSRALLENAPRGLAVSSDREHVLVSHQTGEVSAYVALNPNDPSASSYSLPGFGRPAGIAVDAATGLIYVRDLDSGMHTVGFDGIEWTTPRSSPVGMEFGAAVTAGAGFLYTTHSFEKKVSRWKIDETGTLTSVTPPTFTTGTQPTAIELDSEGRFVFVVSRGDNQVDIYDLVTGAPRLVFTARNAGFAGGYSDVVFMP
jgi:DNA-binding beta-propeller fold protein YncE